MRMCGSLSECRLLGWSDVLVPSCAGSSGIVPNIRKSVPIFAAQKDKVLNFFLNIYTDKLKKVSILFGCCLLPVYIATRLIIHGLKTLQRDAVKFLSAGQVLLVGAYCASFAQIDSPREMHENRRSTSGIFIRGELEYALYTDMNHRFQTLKRTLSRKKSGVPSPICKSRYPFHRVKPPSDFFRLLIASESGTTAVPDSSTDGSQNSSSRTKRNLIAMMECIASVASDASDLLPSSMAFVPVAAKGLLLLLEQYKVRVYDDRCFCLNLVLDP